jgi:peptide deformylase
MLGTLRAGEGRMAIAANRVGVLKRVFVAEVGDTAYVVVDPVMEHKTPETESALEGRPPIPRIGVERRSGVVVSGRDEEGRTVRHAVTGEIARMMQHETDHLDGVLMLDRADPQSREGAMRRWRERLPSRWADIGGDVFDVGDAMRPGLYVGVRARVIYL